MSRAGDWCPVCGDFSPSVHHRCPPKWSVQPEDGDSPHVVFADDAEEAAEKWAAWEDHHSAEYSIVGGRDEPTVAVTPIDGGETKRFKLSGEAVPHYHAKALP